MMKNLNKALDLDDDDISVLNSLGMAYVKADMSRVLKNTKLRLK